VIKFFLPRRSESSTEMPMSLRLISRAFALLAGVFLFNSCGDHVDPQAPNGKKAYVNPHKPGSYEHFVAEPTYPKTFAIYKNPELYPLVHDGNSRIILDTSLQRGKLLMGDLVVMDYPISSGRSSHPSPTGRFAILEKIIDKRSNRYGRMYDAQGELVNADADATTDAPPEGGTFEGANMRYWMRFTWDGVGHHIGPIPSSRRAVSHGCIRGYHKAMPDVFAKVKVGTPVTIQ
jgi:lipoprotein-anchoring transpeptidase ErfK/SrfK